MEENLEGKGEFLLGTTEKGEEEKEIYGGSGGNPQQENVEGRGPQQSRTPETNVTRNKKNVHQRKNSCERGNAEVNKLSTFQGILRGIKQRPFQCTPRKKTNFVL